MGVAFGVSAVVGLIFARLHATWIEQAIVGTTLGGAAANGVLGNLTIALGAVCIGGIILCVFYLVRGFPQRRPKP